MSNWKILSDIKKKLDKAEEKRLSSFACLSSSAIRRIEEEKINKGHRQNFSLDTDRIMHSRAYSRYIDKTQVFYLIKNDHITHRVLHVQLVSKISRTIGRFLRLNEDLIEAIALGHDIGHAPFGHDGETFLSNISLKYNLGYFLHNLQSVRFLEKIERKGKGWNLSLQVLDGILCHDGELHSQALYPATGKNFLTLKEEIEVKKSDPSNDIFPMTLEGCVVRMADTISYIGRDIEDAIRLGFISREDLPRDCTDILGSTNGTIVYNLVEDLIANSLNKPYVSFSREVGGALKRLKDFNYMNIYKNELIWKQTPKIELMLSLLFDKYLQDIEKGDENSVIFSEFLEGMSTTYKDQTLPAEMVRDFIAGMTDDYFLRQCEKNLIPQINLKRY